MILTNSMIKTYLKSGEIFIGSDKDTSKKVEEMDFETTAVNLTLDSKFIKWKQFKSGSVVHVDPGAKGFSFEEHKNSFTEELLLDRDNCYTIMQHEFILGWTSEYIKLPQTLAARVEGRSSLGRVGVGVHITAPTIHAEFHGQIQLEIYNHSNIPVILRPGMKIAQLIFEKVDGIPTSKDKPSFHGQGPKAVA